jgi:hypothetical protein
MVKDFYNTTGEDAEDVDKYKSSAKRQQYVIYQHMLETPDATFIRDNFLKLFDNKILMTSIVRSLCNLRDLGLVKVVGRVKGESDHLIFVYALVKKDEAQAIITPLEKKLWSFQIEEEKDGKVSYVLYRGAIRAGVTGAQYFATRIIDGMNEYESKKR